jgi:molybdopterin-guanine dinucleotide biosynthesis protein A
VGKGQSPGQSVRHLGGDRHPVSPHLVSRFGAEAGEYGEKLLVARSEAGLHPVFGLWPVSLAAELEAALERGERKAQDWVRAHKAREVFFPAIKIGGRNVDPFFNVNRPDDLAAAEALLR